MATKQELQAEIICLKCEIADYFLRNYDPEIWDSSMSGLVAKLDRMEGELHRPETFMGEPLIRRDS